MKLLEIALCIRRRAGGTGMAGTTETAGTDWTAGTARAAGMAGHSLAISARFFMPSPFCA